MSEADGYLKEWNELTEEYKNLEVILGIWAGKFMSIELYCVKFNFGPKKIWSLGELRCSGLWAARMSAELSKLKKTTCPSLYKRIIKPVRQNIFVYCVFEVALDLELYHQHLWFIRKSIWELPVAFKSFNWLHFLCFNYPTNKIFPLFTFRTSIKTT